MNNLNLERYSYNERENILSQINQIIKNHPDFILNEQLRNKIEKRSKGWSNFLRKGLSKAHRLSIPRLITYSALYSTGKHSLLRVYNRFKKHDHQRNELLINYREKNNMRLNIRSEREEVYKAFDLAILKHLDVDQFGIGLFEITCSIEMLAKEINIYRIDKQKHARYDTLLNAINDYEKSKQIIVYREFDKEKKVYKPLRFWLTIDFFKARGYQEDDLRNLLKLREHYLYKKNIFNQTKQKYNDKYLARLKKIGVLNLPDKLLRKLIRIKNKLLDMHFEKEAIKQAKKQKKQVEKEIILSKKKELTYQDIFEQFIINNNIAPVYKYVAMNDTAKKYPEKNNEYWYECLLKIGWEPPDY